MVLGRQYANAPIRATGGTSMGRITMVKWTPTSQRLVYCNPKMRDTILVSMINSATRIGRHKYFREKRGRILSRSRRRVIEPAFALIRVELKVLRHEIAP
jgi:hypothetical protein